MRKAETIKAKSEYIVKLSKRDKSTAYLYDGTEFLMEADIFDSYEEMCRTIDDFEYMRHLETFRARTGKLYQYWQHNEDYSVLIRVKEK